MGSADVSESDAARKSPDGVTPAGEVPGFNGGTEPRCTSCQQRIYVGDRFCRHCGYSTTKCTACGKKLPLASDNGGTTRLSAGHFCPSCGAARGGQHVIRTRPAS